MTTTLDDAARRVLGPGEQLRDIQSEALRELATHDMLLVARSGAGKTAVYAIATLLTGRLTVVVSPLLALQRDQVEALRAAGLRAASVSSARTPAQRRTALDEARGGRLDALLLAPEQLVKTDVTDALATADVGLLVVDEAHCVSEWGHDFRPDYLGIAPTVRRLGRPRLLAMTATASPRVRQEIVDRLGMTDSRVLVRDADRPNIWLGVQHCATARDRDDLVVRTVLEESGPTLVYARTHSHADALADALTDAGRPSDAYHAGLPRAERLRVQDDFLGSRTDLLVATSAFGMGVDRADVRLVVHAGLPPSLDSYYQEVGRAGRDEQAARAIAAVLPGEVGLNRFLTSTGGPRPASVRAVLGAVRGGAKDRGQVVATSRLGSRTVARTLGALLEVGAVQHEAAGLRPGTMDDATALRELRERHDRLRALDRSRVDLVQTYADSSDCRRRLLLELLGERHPDRCGTCDSCDAGTSLDVVDSRLTGGQRVVHAQWGPGTVSAVEAERVTVLFEERGYVTLDTEIALDSGLLVPA
ncbi:RecQ family ATP-dependent DNA helicase [Cellulomonas sp. URHD0024]|uniref:RecQ family ATP-dependent DNA helicase n=1 Tax=Cellulomonas sp. URHD0024 TaxID=1302620 RepID=UPI0004172153|nr:RecQ family ATP-dependent DNA helicase [Cellulomonas sp. URHD0024]